jgi:hypothetical protein
LSAGERDHRRSRWGIAAFGVLGLLRCGWATRTELASGHWTLNTVRWVGVVVFIIGS